MKYELTVEIFPSAVFGVPQAGYTVLPAAAGSHVSASFDSQTGAIVGHGSLSSYRGDDVAVNETLEMTGGVIQVCDNFSVVLVEASNAEEAYKYATELLDRFLGQLSLRLRHAFTYEPRTFYDANGQRLGVPHRLDMLQVTTYNLDEVRAALRTAANVVPVTDEMLQRATEYFEQAVFLYQRRSDLAPPISRHFRALVAAVFLSVHKSISTILGDPSSDRDYQSRYKTYGLDYDFFVTKVERVRKLRNDYDVGHYDLSGQGLDVIEANYDEALKTAAEVLTRYSHWLMGDGAVITKR